MNPLLTYESKYEIENILTKYNIGLQIILSLPNATSTHAELDQCFGTFKGSCRSRTLYHLTEKLEANIISIRQNMNNNKTRINYNLIDDMTNLNGSLNKIRDDPEFGGHHEASDEQLSKKLNALLD